MKKVFILFVTVVLLGSCGVRPEFQQGMTERKFLRQNKEAVLSGIDGNQKTYRVNRGDRFYVLATFEEGKLVKLEERELAPAWMQNQPSNQPEGNRRN
ncbi:hypothetical protein [Cecembia calidifontis]|jgi:hypothetical protein|uniref:Lipoprotein n=1 Tax=Cecembia calidifontis TaxID=1187080 RepID=A0A4Q7PCT7_9BACT|nr:hypothetical protein [Cecembia calidifontis]RZS98035.1 hypothetical protein BC751_3666 [Cecembia calidifontis]